MIVLDTDYDELHLVSAGPRTLKFDRCVIDELQAIITNDLQQTILAAVDYKHAEDLAESTLLSKSCPLARLPVLMCASSQRRSNNSPRRSYTSSTVSTRTNSRSLPTWCRYRWICLPKRCTFFPEGSTDFTTTITTHRQIQETPLLISTGKCRVACFL